MKLRVLNSEFRIPNSIFSPMVCPIGTDVRRAAEILKSGGLVAFATETVYGLGGNAFDVRAVARIFEVKARPRFDPLILHVAEATWLEQLATDVPAAARKLADAFWPGPLTLVLPKTDAVPDLVTSGLPTVAVRIPDHPLALELLRETDRPVAAPSANPFGQLSPTRPEHVAEQLGEQIDYILDGGPCRIGIESSVLALLPSAALLRPGGLPVEEIEGLIGPVSPPGKTGVKKGTGPICRDGPQGATHTLDLSPFSPAPKTPLVIAAETPHVPPGQRVGLLSPQPVQDASPYAAVEVLSETGDLREAATNFFAALHRLDAIGLDYIVAFTFPDEGLGRALNDRLERSS